MEEETRWISTCRARTIRAASKFAAGSRRIRRPPTSRLADQGYTAANWPRPWGLDAEPELQFIIDTEIERTGMTHPAKVNGIATNQCGQALLHYGTDAQRERFLPPGLACEEIWCMLFSEPSGRLGPVGAEDRRPSRR